MDENARREEIFKTCNDIAELWANTYPEFRFTQLIVNTMTYYKSDMFYVQDKDVVGRIKEMLDSLTRSQSE